MNLKNDPSINLTTEVRRDAYLQTPNFNYYDKDGKLRQVWYDDAESLTPKYQLAKDMGLRGVGPYRFDQVDPIGQPEIFKSMYDAMRVFTDN